MRWRFGMLCAALAGCAQLGARWESREIGSAESFRGLCVVDSDVAWASGTRGTFARTVDGGVTWQVGTVPAEAETDFRDVEAFDRDSAVLLAAGSPGMIFRTADGGRTWTGTYTNEAEGIFFDAMAFWDDRNGIAFSDPVDGRFLVVTTADGGRSWKHVDPEAIPPAREGEHGFAASGTCLTVSGAGHVWFGTGGSAARVFHSPDRGRSWQVYDTPLASGGDGKGIFSLVFWDERNGVAVGGDYRNPDATSGNAAVTRDGGKTWVPARIPPGGYRSCVALLPGPTLISVGPNGSDLSRDGGRVWTSTGSIGFHAADKDWAVGGDGRFGRFDH